jgi:hypothetical protein
MKSSQYRSKSNILNLVQEVCFFFRIWRVEGLNLGSYTFSLRLIMKRLDCSSSVAAYLQRNSISFFQKRYALFLNASPPVGRSAPHLIISLMQLLLKGADIICDSSSYFFRLFRFNYISNSTCSTYHNMENNRHKTQMLTLQ